MKVAKNTVLRFCLMLLFLIAPAIINEIIAVIIAKFAFKRAGEIEDKRL